MGILSDVIVLVWTVIRPRYGLRLGMLGWCVPRMNVQKGLENGSVAQRTDGCHRCWTTLVNLL